MALSEMLANIMLEVGAPNEVKTFLTDKGLTTWVLVLDAVNDGWASTGNLASQRNSQILHVGFGVNTLASQFLK